VTSKREHVDGKGWAEVVKSMTDGDGKDEKEVSGRGGEGEREMNSRGTAEGGRRRKDVVQYNLSGFLRSTWFREVARRVLNGVRGLSRAMFHAATLLDLDREVVGGRLRVWVVVLLMDLAERLGGGGGVDSNGDKAELTDRASTSSFLVESPTWERTFSKTLASGASSESTAVSAGEASRLSPASTPSESTRVTPLTPEEVMEDDLRRCFVARVGTFKRSGDDEGDSGEDT